MKNKKKKVIIISLIVFLSIVELCVINLHFAIVLI